MQNQNIIITRNQISQWASYIGAAALVLGIIGFIWQGGFTPVIGVLLIVAVVGTGLWALVAPDEFKGFFSGRQVRHSTSAVFATLLLIGIVSLTYVVLGRATLTLDMTENHRFSLSDESLAVLRRVTRPIRITGFYSSAALQLRQVDDQFFRLYETATNGLVTREYVDPNEEPARAAQYNVSKEGDVFISYLNEDGTVDVGTVSFVPRGTSQERDISEAIARLLIAGTLKVYFGVSHGELSIEDGSQQGISGIHNGIQESGLITAPLDIKRLAATGGQIPNDASALILARPTTDFNAGEIAVLDDYLKRGGGVFIMADALFNENAFLQYGGVFSEYLWNTFGIRPLDAVIVDPVSSGQTALDVISAAIFPDNQIASRLNELNAPTQFSVTRALELDETPPENTPNGRVIMSSEQAYGETNLQALSQTNTYQYDEGRDIIGPLTEVAWAHNTQTNGKIVLVGDANFATNGSILIPEGNSILFTDALSWLSGYTDRINFAPQIYATGLPLIFVSGQQLDIIAFVTIILLPGLVLIAGIIVWWRRARA